MKGSIWEESQWEVEELKFFFVMSFPTCFYGQLKSGIKNGNTYVMKKCSNILKTSEVKNTPLHRVNST